MSWQQPTSSTFAGRSGYSWSCLTRGTIDEADQQKGRPIAELPIPDEVAAAGDTGGGHDIVIQHRLAYQSDELVNWCPALGTVLANEEDNQDGKSERGETSGASGFPCVNGCCESPPTPSGWRMIWPVWTGRKASRSCRSDWIGRSTGAEVDFYVGDHFDSFEIASK